MKKFALAITTVMITVVAPASAADAKPKHHHDQPVVQRVIDWD